MGKTSNTTSTSVDLGSLGTGVIRGLTIGVGQIRRQYLTLHHPNVWLGNWYNAIVYEQL
jgi:hypothetical protein